MLSEGGTAGNLSQRTVGSRTQGEAGLFDYSGDEPVKLPPVLQYRLTNKAEYWGEWQEVPFFYEKIELPEK